MADDLLATEVPISKRLQITFALETPNRKTLVSPPSLEIEPCCFQHRLPRYLLYLVSKCGTSTAVGTDAIACWTSQRRQAQVILKREDASIAYNSLPDRHTVMQFAALASSLPPLGACENMCH